MERKIATKGKNKGKEIEVKKQEPVLDNHSKPVLKQSKNWYVEYRDANDVVQKVPGYADKRATEQLAAKLEKEAAQFKEGIVDTFTEHRRTRLAIHVDDYERHLLASSSRQHVKTTIPRIKKVIDGCGFTYFPDIAPSRVQEFISELRSKGLSIQTCNFYLKALKAFCQWCVRDRRMQDNPLVHVQGGNVKEDRRHDRRALQPEELRELLEVTALQPTRYGMTGPDRALLYRVAVETGFRLNELRSLTPESFELGDSPTITVAAGYSKRGNTDVQPIRTELADILRPWLSSRPNGQPVFSIPEKAAKMLKADLEAAQIPYEDSSGRFVDFHALRHTFITNLANAGVAPKMAMDLARHSDINLTMGRYSHTVVADRAEALKALPSLMPPDEVEQQRATGTCDHRPDADMSLCMSDPCSPQAKRLTSADTESSEPDKKDVDRKSEELSPVRSDVTSVDSDRQELHRPGFEPGTFGSVDRCSIQLSQRCLCDLGHMEAWYSVTQVDDSQVHFITPVCDGCRRPIRETGRREPVSATTARPEH